MVYLLKMMMFHSYVNVYQRVPLFQETTIYLLRDSLGKCFIKFYKWMRKSGAVFEREPTTNCDQLRCFGDMNHMNSQNTCDLMWCPLFFVPLNIANSLRKTWSLANITEPNSGDWPQSCPKIHLVGGFNLPLWKNMNYSQLGWWHSQYNMEKIKFMFQTTNQLMVKHHLRY